MSGHEPISPQDLMRYLDGELPPDERARVERALSASTEMQRELAIFRSLKADFQELTFPNAPPHGSVWNRVHARVTRPVGWMLVSAGVAAWMIYGAWLFATSPADPWAKLATAAVAIGVLLLFATVIWERWLEWDKDPYKDVHR
jgi:anti-sigma factor RsiW